VTPKSHNGTVEALRALQTVHRSARKARTQALNQLHAVALTAPDSIRSQLRLLSNRRLVATCAGYRPGESDDLTAITKLALRELATRVRYLDGQIARVQATADAWSPPPHRPRWESMASGPTPPPRCGWPPGTTRTDSARIGPTPRCLAPARSKPRPARPTVTGSTAAATAKPTPPSGPSSCLAWLANPRPRPTSKDAPTKA